MDRDLLWNAADFVGFVIVLVAVGVATNDLSAGAQLGLSTGAGLVWVLLFEVLRRSARRQN